ncbi:MAG: chalcone isomerase family protein [Polyangia bacterium]
MTPHSVRALGPYRAAWLVVCVAGFLIAAAAAARAQQVREPGSGVGFAETRSIDGINYELVGTGLRKRFFTRVYAMALYFDRDRARASAGRAEYPDSYFIHAGFGRFAVLHFLRDVESGQLQDALREGFADWLRGPPGRRELAEALIRLFDRDMKAGSELTLFTSGEGQIELWLPDGSKEIGPKDYTLGGAVWKIWLGDRPVSVDMKRTLLARFPAIQAAARR